MCEKIKSEHYRQASLYLSAFKYCEKTCRVLKYYIWWYI
jgi:hypothetical protein